MENQKATREDILKAHQIYLGRKPESEDFFDEVGDIDKEELKRKFLNSPELLEKSSEKDVDILMFGNCHAPTYTSIINNLTNLNCVNIPANKIKQIFSGELFVSDLIIKSKLIAFVGVSEKQRLEIIDTFNIPSSKLRHLPNFIIKMFHPDVIYFNMRDGTPGVGAGSFWNSRIILFSYILGLNENEALQLFQEKTYNLLGYYDTIADDRKYIADQSIKTGLSISSIFEKWVEKKECFMHGVNHPKTPFLIDVIIQFLIKENLEYDAGQKDFIADKLKKGPIWSTYPEIAKSHGFDGGYYFKFPDTLGKTIQKHGLNLDGFIKWSYENYSKINRDDIQLTQHDQVLFDKLCESLNASDEEGKSEIIAEHAKNPYKNLPDYQFWRRSISSLDVTEVDPAVNPKFTIRKDDKVATAGSCFAQHISKTLSKNGFNFLITENSDSPDAFANNYGVYSARYGNIYSTKQLLQLFDRTYGRFQPIDEAWETEDGRLVDPFRPQIQPGGFASIDELLNSRAQHFDAVKKMFTEMDIFVFTLGLTEIWRSKIDGAVFPLAPGVAGGKMDSSKYEFVNLSVEDVRQDLQAFIDLLSTINPRAQVLLTVSPVPLMATYENRHVLCSTTLSKSILRVASDEVARTNSHVDYFPSYEIITGNFNRGAFFEDDLRSVKPEGVAQVMKTFMKNYTQSMTNLGNTSVDREKLNRNALIKKEYEKNSEIICDEELLDQ